MSEYLNVCSLKMYFLNVGKMKMLIVTFMVIYSLFFSDSMHSPTTKAGLRGLTPGACGCVGDWVRAYENVGFSANSI